ncbi:MAG: AmmeMemoRadiSam system radical SAM enzyme [Candidatus Wukongarchaeota archaeon]|nr:AmmeMemoRadiSam system radical SAM enzyme [Candidatus Wukongarchaeota archaeon]
MYEARFWEPLEDKIVRCTLCPQYCKIREGKRGFCGVRENKEGKLYTLNYGLISSAFPDPIEKKPLFHFWPGSCAYSLGTIGCNLYCLFCQNFTIARAKPEEYRLVETTPKEIVKKAKKSPCKSIAYTYNEPIIWYEFVYDTAKIAKEEGLFNILVTNGFITQEPLNEIAPYINAANVDVKSFNEEFYRKITKSKLQPVLETCKTMVEKGIHLEITTLLIPGYNDSEEELKALTKWVVENLGPEIPHHFSRFYPHFKLLDAPPTPTKTIEKAMKIAKEQGEKYVYAGNIPGHNSENTYCPNCGKQLIRRIGFRIGAYDLNKDATCPQCNTKIPIKGPIEEEEKEVYYT